MQRRRYLASVAGLAATGGCLGALSSALPENGEGEPNAPAECPSFDRSATAVCVGDTDAAASFSRSSAAVSSGGELVTTLTNESTDDVGLNPYAWTLYRRDGDGWTQVAPDAFVEPWRSLDAGESVSWHLQVGDAERTTSDDDVYVGPLDLAGGEYAFIVVAVVDGERTEFVAPFVVE
jgi:hypothetical protein